MDMDCNFEFDSACCVDEAFKKLSTGQYDVVISDYEMPQKDGLQFLKELREGKNDIPFILFTGKGREEVVIQALNLGADNYVNKQGSPEIVYSELAHLVSSAVEKFRSKLRIKNDSLALHSVRDAIVSADANFTITAWNKAAEELFGFSSFEVLQQKIGDVFKKIQVTPQLDELLRQLQTAGQFRGEIVYQNKKGQERNGELNVTSFVSENGKFLGTVAVCSDITERKKVEEVLIESEKNYRNLINGMDESVWVIDFDGNFLEVNNAAVEMLGYSREELQSLGIKGIDNHLNAEQIKNLMSRVASGETQVFETVHTTKDGTEIPVEISSSLIIYQGKQAILAIARNITERKKAEDALRESEKDYSSLFANMIDGFAYCQMIFDEANKPVDFVYLQVNDAFERITGLKRDLIIGKKVSEAIPEIKETNPELFEIYGKVSLTGQKKKFEHVLKPLNLWLNVSVYSPAKGYFAAVLEDITERKKAEEKLKESEEKYQTTFETSMDALMLLDEKGFFDCNKATLELFGCRSVEEFTKFHPADLSPPTQPDGTPSMNAAMSHIQKAFQTGTDHFFWMHKRMDGTTFPADVLLTRTPLKGREVLQATVRDVTELKNAEDAIKFQADLLNHVGQAVIMVDNNRTIRFWNKVAEKLYGYSEEQALGHKVNELLGGTSEEADEITKRLMAGESWSNEALAKNRDGSFVPVILNRAPIFNGDGEFVGAASITTDITLQKNTEADLTFALDSLSNSLDKIEQLNEKLRVVGGLTRHDVRNKLSVITGYAYILKKKHSGQADIVDGLCKVEQVVNETVRIFDFAKMYEQLGEEELTYINVEEKLKEAAALFSGPTPAIMNECHGLTVLADSFLRQLFYNFIDNTRKYGKKTTTIRVYFERADQDSLKLVYEDDGVGVPSENKPRLFSEGFSTEGTGFGLFLIKKMMDVYDWRIQENGTPGEGAKFTITIPKLNKNGKENYQIEQ